MSKFPRRFRRGESESFRHIRMLKGQTATTIDETTSTKPAPSDRCGIPTTAPHIFTSAIRFQIRAHDGKINLTPLARLEERRMNNNSKAERATPSPAESKLLASCSSAKGSRGLGYWVAKFWEQI